MKRHLLILFGYSSLFLISEILYRFLFNIPAITLSRIAETFGILFAVISAYYFAKYRITRFIIALFFALTTIINAVHYEVYEGWISSTNYFLLLTEITEVTTTGVTMLDKVLPAALWGTVETLIFLSISKFRRKTSLWADVLVYVFFIYMFVRSFNTNNDIGLTPRTYYSRIKANTFAFTSFIGRILPYELLELSNLPDYRHDKPNVTSAPKVRNIIFILGESFSAKHVHAFGYNRETTPFLDSLLTNGSQALLKPTYAAGLGTAISLPALLSAVPYPNGLNQIVKGDTNLFHLAQEQGFKTAFHSSQPEWEMEILGIMGRKWMDEVTFPTQLGFSPQSAMNDHKTLDYLFNTDLSTGQHFFVLHQRGSHGPYAKYLEPDQKRFTADTPLDNYDSTIYDTDLFIKKVFDYLSQQPQQDWLLVYTSDHGQNVTNEVYNQGTTAEGSYLVPTMIYTPNQQLQQQINAQFSACSKIFHQQLATLFISLLGYDMPVSDCQSGVINANLLTGNSGYLKVDAQGKLEFVYPDK